MMPADKVILQYRDKLDEFEARGWRLDMKRCARHASKATWCSRSVSRAARNQRLGAR
jgi:hypothetical protein